MEADQYQKIKEIFQSVLEAPTDQRQELLNERCAADSDVRAEVERLLDSYESGFLENPAVGEFAAGFTGNGFESGGTIGHYTIIRKIGSGGMGEVYLAEDGKLGRHVAIKLLPETFTEDEDRLRRFEQEARTASALNHPNILTIHEIGETGDTRYIATEYIDGETLRARLNRGRLSVSEALAIAIQCASALAAAHESGIIHRDIKPENIMLRPDNLVKQLDFGLAKLTDSSVVADGSEISHAPTERHVRTAPGVIMGTVQYMSPEQTRGHATDARTDIWSLGVVLYEMIAGTSPFEGNNTADLIAEIVKTYPVPVSQTADDIPERLDEIVEKALEKSPDERYQSAHDLLIDLNRLSRERENWHQMQGLAFPTAWSNQFSFASKRADNAARDTNYLIADPTSPERSRNANVIDSDSIDSPSQILNEDRNNRFVRRPTSRRMGLTRGLKAFLSGLLVAFTFLVLLHVLQIVSIAVFENKEKLSTQDGSPLIEMSWRLLDLFLIPIGLGYFLGIALVLFGAARMFYALFERGYTSSRAFLIEKILAIVILISIGAIAIPNLIASRNQALRIREEVRGP